MAIFNFGILLKPLTFGKKGTTYDKLLFEMAAASEVTDYCSLI
jgi:hypothetical protein